MMKAKVKQGLIFALSALLVAGCSSRGDYQEWGAHVDADDCYFPDQVKEPAPKWVCTGTWKNSGLSAVGSYHQTDAGVEFQKSMAMTEARARIAELAQIRVEQLVKQHAQSSTQGGVERSSRSDSLIRRELTATNLPGTEIYAMTINPETQRMYVIVGMNDARAERYFSNIINKEFSGQSTADTAAAEQSLDRALSSQ